MLKRLIFAVIALALFLLLAEGSARLIERSAERWADDAVGLSGWQAKFFGSLFNWHEGDPDLLWRFKPNLANRYIQTNSTHTIGPEIRSPKPPTSFRILLLGDSSPVGLGLGLDSYDLSFGPQLQRRLQDLYGEHQEVELINAAVSGYTSEQLVRYLELHGWGFEPDVVILYCGNNDASISGFQNDRELMRKQRLSQLRALLSRTALYRVLRAALAPGCSSAPSHEMALQVRVTPDQYGENLATIAEQCHRRDCPLIIVKPPVPLRWPAGLQFKPFRRLEGSDGQLIIPEPLAECLNRPIRYCLDRERLPSWYHNADKVTRLVYASAYRDTLPPTEAVSYYAKQLEVDSQSPILWNNLGVACWESKRYAEADSCLRKARQESVRAFDGLPDPASQALGTVFLFNIGINLMSAAQYDSAALQSDTALAFTYLDSALQGDYLSLRVKRSYLEQIDSLGEEWENVTVVDMPTVFAQNGGESLFIDHCHPTAKGHRLIAQEIFEAMKTGLAAQE